MHKDMEGLTSFGVYEQTAADQLAAATPGAAATHVRDRPSEGAEQ